jgi:hypothetical protein
LLALLLAALVGWSFYGEPEEHIVSLISYVEQNLNLTQDRQSDRIVTAPAANPGASIALPTDTAPEQPAAPAPSEVETALEAAPEATTEATTEALPEITPDHVRIRIERFALTANNITYAVIGDMLGYWNFFPTDKGWGRVPAMGWGEVIASTHADVPAGGRYYGWFPMTQFVDLTVGPTADGLRDDGEHRQAHAPVYRSYVETALDPMYPSRAPRDERGDAEDRHSLLRGLYLTGFLADTFFADADHFGAHGAVVLSASAKTSIGFAQ